MIQACPSLLPPNLSKSVSLEAVLTPFTEVMYRLLLLHSGKFKLQKILLCPAFFAPLRAGKASFFARGSSFHGHLHHSGTFKLEIFDHEIFQEKPATPITLFRRLRKYIRKAKFFSCSVMINSTSLTNGNLIRKSSKNFRLLFLTGHQLKKQIASC